MKYLIFAAAAAVGMMLSIQWDKETVKAFITGGVIVWLALTYWRKS